MFQANVQWKHQITNKHRNQLEYIVLSVIMSHIFYIYLAIYFISGNCATIVDTYMKEWTLGKDLKINLYDWEIIN